MWLVRSCSADLAEVIKSAPHKVCSNQACNPTSAMKPKSWQSEWTRSAQQLKKERIAECKHLEKLSGIKRATWLHVAPVACRPVQYGGGDLIISLIFPCFALFSTSIGPYKPGLHVLLNRMDTPSIRPKSPKRKTTTSLWRVTRPHVKLARVPTTPTTESRRAVLHEAMVYGFGRTELFRCWLKNAPPDDQYKTRF